jgi:tetratricopeptide (TPR) repeat protein
MGATIKTRVCGSRRAYRVGGFRPRNGGTGQHAIVLFTAILVAFLSVFGAETDFVTEAQAAYQKAREAAANSNYTNELRLAIAAFDFAEFAKDDDQREEIAEIGIAASRRAVALDGKAVAGHYYLALNLGQLARTKMLGALKLIGEMEREFLKSIELDRKFDYAGAPRALGVLYMETPSWSIGSKTKARENMEKALELAPNYPDNHLTYMEALLKWKDRETMATTMAAYEVLLPKAKKEFAGKEWAWEWTDWDKRWAAMQAKGKRK